MNTEGSYQKLLEQSILRMAGGDERFRQVVLPLLASSILHIPLRNFRATAVGANVYPMFLHRFGYKILPVFTSEALLNTWTKMVHCSLPIAGVDLGLVINDSTSIILNPNRDLKNNFLKLDEDDLPSLQNSAIEAKEIFDLRARTQLVKTRKNRIKPGSMQQTPWNIASDALYSPNTQALQELRSL